MAIRKEWQILATGESSQKGGFYEIRKTCLAEYWNAQSGDL
jgi:hypothetical protein